MAFNAKKSLENFPYNAQYMMQLRGMRCADFKRACGMNPKYVIFRGGLIIHAPKLKRLAMYAHVLGCRISDLTSPVLLSKIGYVPSKEAEHAYDNWEQLEPDFRWMFDWVKENDTDMWQFGKRYGIDTWEFEKRYKNKLASECTMPTLLNLCQIFDAQPDEFYTLDGARPTFTDTFDWSEYHRFGQPKEEEKKQEEPQDEVDSDLEYALAMLKCVVRCGKPSKTAIRIQNRLLEDPEFAQKVDAERKRRRAIAVTSRIKVLKTDYEERSKPPKPIEPRNGLINGFTVEQMQRMTASISVMHTASVREESETRRAVIEGYRKREVNRIQAEKEFLADDNESDDDLCSGEPGFQRESAWGEEAETVGIY